MRQNNWLLIHNGGKHTTSRHKHSGHVSVLNEIRSRKKFLAVKRKILRFDEVKTSSKYALNAIHTDQNDVTGTDAYDVDTSEIGNNRTCLESRWQCHFSRGAVNSRSEIMISSTELKDRVCGSVPVTFSSVV